MTSDRLTRLPALVGGALVTVCAAYGFMANPKAKRSQSVLNAEPRFRQRMRVAAPGASLARILTAASDATRCVLRCGTESVGDRKVVIYAQEPLENTLALAARHLDLHWRRGMDASGQTEWILETSLEREQLTRQRRAENTRESIRRLQTRLECAIQSLNAEGSERKALLAKYPFIQQSLVNPPLRARIELAARLSRSQREALLSGDNHVSPFFGQMSEPERTSAATAMLFSGEARKPAPGAYFTLSREFRDGVYQLWFRSYDPVSGAARNISGTVVPFDTPLRASGRPMPQEALMRSSKSAPMVLRQELNLEGERGQQLPSTATLPNVLASLANASGIAVISDFSADPRIRYDPVPFGRRPIWQMLDLIAAQYACNWEYKNGYIFLRRDRRPEDEVEEIPERLLEPWLSSDSKSELVSPAEFLHVLHSLTAPQIQQLPCEFSGIYFTEDLSWEKLIASLTPVQQRCLLTGHRVLITPMESKQMRLMSALIGRPGVKTETGTLELLSRSGAPKFEVRLRCGRREMRYEASLPLKHRQPTPVSATRVAGG